MPSLTLELHAGDPLIVNDAPMRFRNRATVELTTYARFLVGKQIMPPAEVTSPARRIYFALQTAYIGAEEERGPGLAQARELVGAFKAATTSALARAILDRAVVLAEAGRGHQALKLARRVVQHEDEVLSIAAGPAPASTGSDSPAAH